MADKDNERDDAKQSLPPGHPQAGYVGPDLTGTQGVGALPDEEQEWRDTFVEGHEDEVKAVAEHEDQVAKQEAEDQAASAETKEETPAQTKTQTKASTATKDQS